MADVIDEARGATGTRWVTTPNEEDSDGVPSTPRDYASALERAASHARSWLTTLPDRPIPFQADADAIRARLGESLLDDPADPAEVVDELADAVEPGLLAIPSGRFYGWVMGGTLPAALAADWLTSAWDQNTGMRIATPGTAAVEEVAGVWLLDLLGLPPGSDVGFTTGATMANFTGLAAARHHLLDRVGWDDLTRRPDRRASHPMLAGAERHESLVIALRYLGLGAPSRLSRWTSRAGSGWMRCGLGSPTMRGPRSSACRRATCIPVRSMRSRRLPRSPTSTRPGYTSTGRSGSGQPPRRGCALVPGLESADSWATDAHKTPQRALRLRRLGRRPARGGARRRWESEGPT